jgi:hypothetical protein
MDGSQAYKLTGKVIKKIKEAYNALLGMKQITRRRETLGH